MTDQLVLPSICLFVTYRKVSSNQENRKKATIFKYVKLSATGLSWALEIPVVRQIGIFADFAEFQYNTIITDFLTNCLSPQFQ